MAGRPRKIQGEVERRLLKALSNGAPIRIACGAAGVAQSVYFDECQRNPEFAKQATRARDEAAAEMLELIKVAGKEDWRAAAKFIELSHPRDFNVQRHEVTGAEGGPVEFTLDLKAGD